jgi:hypothetical protein
MALIKPACDVRRITVAESASRRKLHNEWLIGIVDFVSLERVQRFVVQRENFWADLFDGQHQIFFEFVAHCIGVLQSLEVLERRRILQRRMQSLQNGAVLASMVNLANTYGAASREVALEHRSVLLHRQMLTASHADTALVENRARRRRQLHRRLGWPPGYEAALRHELREREKAQLLDNSDCGLSLSTSPQRSPGRSSASQQQQRRLASPPFVPLHGQHTLSRLASRQSQRTTSGTSRASTPAAEVSSSLRQQSCAQPLGPTIAKSASTVLKEVRDPRRSFATHSSVRAFTAAIAGRLTSITSAEREGKMSPSCT